ncbi:MAG: PilZ domain-containing protein [Deltaproteobacteria bacterium]|nr:PilZ domain-containing protein [bacterium]MCB9476780.1 PilZ domain-containing protein [Deltaproteobacteria bacterium]MCB9487405.1 PilZ domain-containing protein [Deltaproteobacteria bacterium]
MAKKVFTTGDVARLLGININTVIKWFDDGKLDGFRLPTSHERRIPRSALRSFMIEHHIPLDLLAENQPANRTLERLPVDFSAELSTDADAPFGPYRARIKNLSANGARVQISDHGSVAIPTRKFAIQVNITDGPLRGARLSGKVVHMTPSDSNLGLGLLFNNIEDAVKTRIEAFISESRAGL